jgi:two-component system sensor histidine kinase/response regulator
MQFALGSITHIFDRKFGQNDLSASTLQVRAPQLSNVNWLRRAAASTAFVLTAGAPMAAPAQSGAPSPPGTTSSASASAVAPSSAASAASSARILFLNSYGYGRYGVEAYTRSFMAAMSRNGVSVNDVMVEHLDLNRAGTPAQKRLNRDLLLSKYAGQHIDLIVTTQQPALNYLLDDLKTVAPQAPVMAAVATLPASALSSQHAFLVQKVRVDIGGTIDSMLAAFPKTRRAVIVLGTGEEDMALKREFQANAGRLEGRVDFEYLNDLGYDEMLKRVSNLPARTAVILGIYNRDKHGGAFIPVEVGQKVVATANAPLFALYDSVMGTGAVGGSMLRIQEDAASDADLAVSLIRGQTRLSAQVSPLPRHFVPMFDAQAITRWGGDPFHLPPGSVVVNQPMTLWGQYRTEVSAAALLLVVLSTLSITLLIQNRRRLQAEYAARESEARFRVLVEQAPEAIFVFDAEEMRFVDANANAESLTGLTRDELLKAGPERLYDPEQPDKQPVTRSFLVHVQQALEGQEVVFDRVVVTPQGQRKYCEVRVVRLPSKGRQLLRASYIDISQRREAEQAVLQLNAELEQRVLERTAQLQSANNDLAQARDTAQEATRVKSEFLANMSHEIRTPMNAILGMTNLAMGTELSPKQKGYLGHVKSAASSLLKIIDDILDFSKVEAGKLEMESCPFLLDDVLDRVASVTGLKARDKGLDLLLSVPPQIPQSLVGDPVRLGQVLINLCANAVKFTAHGEVVLAVTRLDEPVADGRVVLRFSVRDTGIGMNEEQVQRLFQPFSQVDASTTRLYGGTGLGLAISKQIVGLMQGQIQVDSCPGQGSDFHFTATFGRGQAVVPQPTAPISLRGLRVLVMDGSASARAILEMQLKGLGYEVAAVAGSAAGLAELERAALQNTPYHLALLDWSLAGTRDAQLLHYIRDMPALRGGPRLVLVAAHGDDQPTNLVVSGLVDGCFFRLGNTASLLEAIATAFGRHVPSSLAASPSQSTALPSPLSPPAKVLKGRRVLLVEDNLINQMVASELLADAAGVVVIIANDGAQAIERIAAEPFDAVLMDVQMPVMDGIRATTLIRQDWSAEQLPIIGMTAHAMVRDREKCLSAGMNDYVTKPFEPQQLFAVLAKWMKGGADAPSSSLQESDAVDPGTRAVSIELGLQRCLGRKDLYAKIVRRFLDTRGNDPSDLQAAILAGDLDTAAQLAHQVISTAGTIGAEALSEAGRALQLALEAGEASRWPDLQTTFSTQHALVANELRRYLRSAVLAA